VEEREAMQVGDRIVRKSTLAPGYIVQANKMLTGTYMVRIQWDSDNSTQWLPSEEVRPWDKLPLPPEQPALRPTFSKTPWGEQRRKGFAAKKLADQLAALSGKHKNRAKNKASKMIAKWERGN
jgi:hypothetical protein